MSAKKPLQTPLVYSLIASFTLGSTATHAAINPAEVNQWLRAFQMNPRAQIDAPVIKRNVKNGRPIGAAFSPSMVNSGKFIDAKNFYRSVKFGMGERGKAGILPNDRVENLVDNNRRIVRRIEEMQNLTQARLETMPWSDTYWPLFGGTLAWRYADRNYSPNEKNFDQTLKYVLQDRFAADLLRNASSLDDLSPAEKYDILVGNTVCPTAADRDINNWNDRCFGFTKRALRQGKGYWDEQKQVEGWMGICHGWAPASYMEKTPYTSVQVISAEGFPIKFFPSDIKALASMMWAFAPYETKFIGGRCNAKKPRKDEATGRITTPDCFDNNPGTVHMAIVNQIGIAKRSLVIDATYDYEVWNHPVYSYQYSYFNPQTNAYTTNLSEALVPIANYQNDKFKKFRDPRTKSVVGVVMQLQYMIENEPNHKERLDDSDNDSYTSNYYYDLELDENGVIIGGEWYQNQHPDFLWTPSKNTRAQSFYEEVATENWNMSTRLPGTWQLAAQQAVGQVYEGIPLRKILDALLNESNRPVLMRNRALGH